jgi:hypothetical protein
MALLHFVDVVRLGYYTAKLAVGSLLQVFVAMAQLQSVITFEFWT